jgi:hypothetical protein
MFEEREVIADNVEAREVAASEEDVEGARERRERRPAGHIAVVNAVDARCAERNRHAGIDPKDVLVLATVGVDDEKSELDDPVTFDSDAGRLEVEEGKWPTERQRVGQHGRLTCNAATASRREHRTRSV